MSKNKIKNIKNIEDFIKQSKEIKKILQIEDIETNLINSPYSNKISDNPLNLNILLNQLETKKETLMISATGSGKTWTINELFNTFSFKYDVKARIKDGMNEEEAVRIIEYFKKNDPKFKEQDCNILNILLCPNKIQNLQNETTYTLKAVISGITTDDLVFRNSCYQNNYSAVYDKAREMKEFIKETLKDGKRTYINLVVDEFHCLYQSLGFRQRAIEEVEDLIEYVKEQENSSIIYMTATYNCLMLRNFDTIINFYEETPTAKTDKIKVYRNKNKATQFKNFMNETIKTNCSDNIMVRYNTLEGINELSTDLIIDDYKVQYINSQEKNYKEVKDELGKVIDLKYDNEMFDGIIRSSKLQTSNINGKNAWITTSMMDAGTNILSVNNKELSSLEPVYILNDTNNCNIDNIIQFFSRIRYKVNDFVIIMNYRDDNIYKTELKTEENPTGYFKKRKFKTLQSMISYEYNKANKSVESFKISLEAIKSRLELEEELTEKEKSKSLELQINQQLNFVSVFDNTTNNLNGSIYYEDGEIKFNINKFFMNVYNKYLSQFIFFQDRFFKQLKEAFNTEIEVIDNLENIKSDYIKSNKITKDVLYEALEDDEVLNELVNNKVKNKNLIKIRNSKEYGDMMELLNMKKYNLEKGEKLSKEEVKNTINTILKNNRTQTNKLKDDKLSSIIKDLNTDLYKQIVLKEIDKTKLKGQDKQLYIYEIVNNSRESDLFKKIVKIGGNIDEAIDLFCKADEITRIEVLKDYIIEHEVSIINEKYFNNKKEEIAGKCGLEIKIVLDNLITLNEKGLIKRIKLNDKNIKKCRDALNNYFETNKYNNSSVEKIIRSCLKFKSGSNELYGIVGMGNINSGE